MLSPRMLYRLGAAGGFGLLGYGISTVSVAAALIVGGALIVGVSGAALVLAEVGR